MNDYTGWLVWLVFFNFNYSYSLLTVRGRKIEGMGEAAGRVGRMEREACTGVLILVMMNVSVNILQLRYECSEP